MANNNTWIINAAKRVYADKWLTAFAEPLLHNGEEEDYYKWVATEKSKKVLVDYAKGFRDRRWREVLEHYSMITHME